MSSLSNRETTAFGKHLPERFQRAGISYLKIGMPSRTLDLSLSEKRGILMSYFGL